MEVKPEGSRSYRKVKMQDCKTLTEEIRRPGVEPALEEAVCDSYGRAGRVGVGKHLGAQMILL